MTRRHHDDESHVGRGRRPRAGRDSGTTLVEIVITVSIMAVVIAPLLTAVMMTIRFSAQRDQSATLESVLNSASDRISRAPRTCDYTMYLNAAVSEYGWSPSQAAVAQSRYLPGPNPAIAGSWTTGACVGATPESLVQLVKVTIISPTSGASRTIEVVKSNV